MRRTALLAALAGLLATGAGRAAAGPVRAPGAGAFVPPPGHVPASKPSPGAVAATPPRRARPPEATFSTEGLTESQVETAKALLRVRLYRVLWKHDPTSFGRLVREVDASKRAEESPAALLLVARSRVMPLVRRHVAHAEARTLSEYVGNLLIEIRKVAPQAGEACFALLAADDDAAMKLADADLGTLDDFALDRLADAVKQISERPAPALPCVLATMRLAKYWQSATGATAFTAKKAISNLSAGICNDGAVGRFTVSLNLFINKPKQQHT